MNELGQASALSGIRTQCLIVNVRAITIYASARAATETSVIACYMHNMVYYSYVGVIYN
jgi:hypothetical protein